MPNYLPPPSNLSPGSTVWAYLRDSGGINQDQSVPQQRNEIQAYCNNHGLILVKIFADIARSGTSISGRDAFDEMMSLSARLKERPAGLLVWNFARFARNLDDATYFKSMLRRNGIVVHSINEPLPEGDQSRFMEMAYDYSAQLESERKSRDSKRGLAFIVKQGFSSGGYPPRGYKAIPVKFGKERYSQKPHYVSKWIPDPKLSDMVDKAFQLRAQGKSYEEITEATHGRLYRSKNSWYCFFRNKTYIGIGKCGELEISEHHAALVDRKTWDMVQRIQQDSKYRCRGGLMHPRRLSNPSLLSGLAYCIFCGSAMFKDRVGKNDWDCYVCGRKRRQNWKSCKNRAIGSHKADKAVIGAILDRILTTDLLTILIEEMQKQFLDKVGFQKRIDQIGKELSNNDKMISNLLDEIEESRSGLASERLKTRENEQANLLFELQILERKLNLNKFEITNEALEVIVSAWRNNVFELQKTDDIQAMKLFIKNFINKVELGYKKAVIWYTYPIESLQDIYHGKAIPLDGGTYKYPSRTT